MERRFLGFGIAAASLAVAIAAVAQSSTAPTEAKYASAIYSSKIAGKTGAEAEAELRIQFGNLKKLATYSPTSTKVADSATYLFDQMVKAKVSPSFVLESVEDLRPTLDHLYCKKALLVYAVVAVLDSLKTNRVELTDEQREQLIELNIESQLGQNDTENLRAMVLGLTRVDSDPKWIENVGMKMSRSPLSNQQKRVAGQALECFQPNGGTRRNYYAHIGTYVQNTAKIRLNTFQRRTLNLLPIKPIVTND